MEMPVDHRALGLAYRGGYLVECGLLDALHALEVLYQGGLGGRAHSLYAVELAYCLPFRAAVEWWVMPKRWASSRIACITRRRGLVLLM